MCLKNRLVLSLMTQTSLKTAIEKTRVRSEYILSYEEKIESCLSVIVRYYVLHTNTKVGRDFCFLLSSRVSQ